MSGMRKKRKKRAAAAEAEAAQNENAAGAAEDAEPEAAEDAEPEAAEDAEPEDAEAAEPEAAESAEPEAAEAAGDGDAEEEGPEALTPERVTFLVESLLFAAERPLTPKQLRDLIRNIDVAQVEAALEKLLADYEGRGIVLHVVGGGYQFRTAPQSSEFVQRMVAGRPVRLSRAQLETLAITAYRQPITRPEIDEIRGVDSGGTLRVLLERGLIRVLGKKEEPGRPLLYGTTKDFLEFFNLNDLRDLPTLREYHELTEDSMRVVEEMGIALGDLAENPDTASAEAPAAEPAPEDGDEVEAGDESDEDDEDDEDVAASA